jgi:hypothetical protein
VRRLHLGDDVCIEGYPAKEGRTDVHRDHRGIGQACAD